MRIKINRTMVIRMMKNRKIKSKRKSKRPPPSQLSLSSRGFTSLRGENKETILRAQGKKLKRSKKKSQKKIIGRKGR